MDLTHSHNLSEEEEEEEEYVLVVRGDRNRRSRVSLVFQHTVSNGSIPAER